MCYVIEIYGARYDVELGAFSRLTGTVFHDYYVKEESLEILVGNAVRYIKRNTKYFSTCNWIAQELFFDVIPDELIGEIFNKKVFADDEDDIRLILNASNSESFDNLVRNSVAYAESYNRSKINEIARDIFKQIISAELIAEIFNKE